MKMRRFREGMSKNGLQILFLKKEILFKGMIRSQFSYCPLIWMFTSEKSNSLINKLHERSLRTVSGDNQLAVDSSFKSLLSKSKEITIHQRNLQVLMTETYTRLLMV